MTSARTLILVGALLLAVPVLAASAHANQGPKAMVAGPYAAGPGKPVYLDGTASSDPDGDALTYLWDFGDGNSGSGPEPLHIFATSGTFNVALRVTDPEGLFDVATTWVTVSDVQPATVFYPFGFNLILPQVLGTSIHVQPVSGSFDVRDAIVSTLRLTYDGQTVPSLCKSRIGSDTNRDGLQEVVACFRNAEIKTLFASVPNGVTPVTLTLQVDLTSGSTASGTVTANVVKFSWLRPGSISTVSPNPLNPQAKLSFVTMEPGTTRIQLFDIRGRLVRTLMEAQYLDAGVHDVLIDGRNEQGNRLASGIYYYRLQSADGVSQGNIAVMK